MRQKQGPPDWLVFSTVAAIMVNLLVGVFFGFVAWLIFMIAWFITIVATYIRTPYVDG